MQIVIDIDEWKYKSICEGVEASKRCGVATMNPYIDEAIYKGIPLPKGQVIDVNIREVHGVKSITAVLEATVIIPAERESEEGQ